jgi:hypothetical protein
MSQRVIVAIAILGFAGGVRADATPTKFPPVIAVKSVTGPPRAGTTAPPPWEIVTRQPSSHWCQDGTGETLAIALAAPAALDAVVVQLKVDAYHENAIKAIEVTAGDRVRTGKLKWKPDQIEVEIGGAPVSNILVKIAAVTKGESDITCVEKITLVTTPASAVVYGVDAKAAAALAPDVQAIRDALRACDKKLLARRLAFPFSIAHHLDLNDVDHRYKRVTSFENAAAVANACKTKELADATKALELQFVGIQATAAGKIDLLENTLFYVIELDGEHWKLRAIQDPL